MGFTGVITPSIRKKKKKAVFLAEAVKELFTTTIENLDEFRNPRSAFRKKSVDLCH